jgi:alpha-tubulin suppressor-like RCC1 family protein
VVGGDLGLVQVSAGGNHSLGVDDEGGAWAWGDNDNGQLGDGTDSDATVPVPVIGVADVISVVAGGEHSVALLGDGTVWGWGYNRHGQLGDGDDVEYIPRRISGLANVMAIAAGEYHSVALLDDGTVWSVGSTDSGERGDGVRGDAGAYTATPVQSDLEGARAITAGGHNTIALATDGTAWVWGANYYMSPDFDSSDDSIRARPMQVVELTDVEAISAGRYHSLVTLADGSVWGWGDNEFGQLGDTPDRSYTPTEILAP